MYSDFIDTNDIEFGILLCNELFDNAADGITYKEAKSRSSTLDVIELNREHDSSRDDGNAEHHDPVGYDELLQAIRAIIWSNVNMKKKSATASTASTTVADGGAADGGSDDEEDDANIEADLAGFEQLLSEVMMFKEATSTWSRSERLAHAEKFACE